MISSIEIINDFHTDHRIPENCVLESIEIGQINESRLTKGLKCVQLKSNEYIIDYFVKLCRYNKLNAVEFLLQNTNKYSIRNISMSVELLKDLWFTKSLSEFEEEDLMALFLVLSDSADDMSRITGPVAASESNIFLLSKIVAREVFSILSREKRLTLVSNAIRAGKAKSWLIYFVLGFMWVPRVSVEKLQGDGRMMEQGELDLYKNLAKERLFKILEEGYWHTSNPLFLFLFWEEISSETEKKQIKDWAICHTETDTEFLRFVDVFSKKKLEIVNNTKEYVYWWVSYSTLDDFYELEQAKLRLNVIIERGGKLSNVANELLRRIVSAETYMKEREAGLHRPTLIRG